MKNSYRGPRRFVWVVSVAAVLGMAAAGPAQSPPSTAPADPGPTVRVGGLLQGQFEAGERGDSRFADGNDRFYLRRARLNASGRFIEEFDYRIEGELSGTLANTAGLRAQLTDGYVEWTHFSFARVRVGQFKTPYGFEQLYSDPRLFLEERTLVNDRLTQGRQLGAQVGGDLFDKRLSYAVGLFNGTGANNDFNDDNRYLWASRVSFVPLREKLLGRDVTLSAGADGYLSQDASLAQPAEFGFNSKPAVKAPDNVFAGKRRAWGLDAQIRSGPLEIWAEYLRAVYQPDDRIPVARLSTDGWYVQGSYVLFQRWQVIARYDRFDPNADARGDDTRTWTAGLNFLVRGHDLKLQANYLRTTLPGSAPGQKKLIARLQAAF